MITAKFLHIEFCALIQYLRGTQSIRHFFYKIIKGVKLILIITLLIKKLTFLF